MDWVTFCITTSALLLAAFFWIRHIKQETRGYRDELSMLAARTDSDGRRRLLARHYFNDFKKEYPDLAEDMADVTLEEMAALGVNLFKSQ